MVVVLMLVGCGPDWSLTDEPERSAVPTLQVEDNVIETVITTIDRGLPARFSADWPADATEMGIGRFPVADHWAHQICLNNGNARERYVEAVNRADTDGIDLDPWGGLVWDWCREPDFCEWVTVQLDAEPDHRLNLLWYFALEDCRDPALKPRFEREEAPWGAVVDWFALQSHLGRPEANPALERAIGVGFDHGRSMAPALRALGGIDSEESAAALLRLWSRLNDPVDAELQREVAFAMHKQSDPSARERFLRTCDAIPDDYRCQRPADPLQDLAAAVVTYQIDLEELLSDHPMHASAIHNALADCYRSAVDSELAAELGDRCMLALLEADRPRAVQLAQDTSGLEFPVAMESLASQIRTYPDDGSLRDALIGWGLLPEGAEPAGLTAEELLVDAEVAWRIHDYGSSVHVARELASRAGGLHDVAFSIWVPPPPPEDGGVGLREPRPLLQAFMDGKRHQVLTRNYEVGSDSEQSIGLVNGLLEFRELRQRIVMIDPEIVFFGDSAGMKEAIEAGLFAPYVSDFDDSDYGSY